MATVIYDRNGKPHTIGGNKKSDEESSEKSPAKSKEKPSHGGAKPGKKVEGKKSYGDERRSTRPGSSATDRSGAKVGDDKPYQKKFGAKKFGETSSPEDTRSSPRSGRFGRDEGRGGRGGSGGGRAGGRDGGSRGGRFGRDEGRSGSTERRNPWDKPPGKSASTAGVGAGGKFIQTGEGRATPSRGYESPTKKRFAQEHEENQKPRRGKYPEKEKRSKFDKSDKKGGYRKPEEKGPKKSNVDKTGWTNLKGVIDKNKRGSAFLVFDRRDLEDVFIPRFYVEQLFHGDRVDVAINAEGEIEDIKVLEHRFKEIFGKITIDKRSAENKKLKMRAGYLVYERKKAKEEIWVPSLPPEVKEGDWVKAELIYAETEEGSGRGAASAKITQVIGPMLPAIYDIQMVAGEFNLTEHHSYEAVKQAEGYKLEVPGKDELGRTDLRHIPFMTIDGERARDFDDAVYVENLGKEGYRLWVAIADVSHYVKEGTPLDVEAYARATSVYFPERAFHMLPRALSEELCSLKPNVPRLSMACSIDYNAEGEKGKIELYDAIIESRRRATYNEIEAEKADPKHADLFALYRILRKQRTERGSIDFDFPEAEIILDEKTGEPTDIVVRPRVDAHRLIEEFMIRANESVTEWMLVRKLPFVYRVHEEPSPEAIAKFKKLARTMGVQLADKGGIPRPKDLADFIATLKGHSAEIVLSTALLRSMRQAIYSATYGEHYGLASEGYTHFTSPIRRYPDLVVHRQLRAALHREQAGEKHPSGEEEEKVQNLLEETAEHCSYRERIATEAERESIRFKSIRLMAKHLGEEFDGKVNGLNANGFFVQLFHPYCEGMVPVESLEDDWYEYQEERMVMVGRKTKRAFQIGQLVKIQVVRVDMDARQIEFKLIEEKKTKDGEEEFTY